MKRRDFLIGGMGALAAGVTGCASINPVIAPNWPNITPLQMNRFLTDLDGSMNHIVENPEGGQFISQLRQREPSEKDAQFFRQGMRSLLLVGNFGDLSVAGQVHPGVQKRLHYSVPEMDAAVQGTVNQMKSLSPTARADIQFALREDPTLGARVLEAIDLETAAVGASNRRRMQLHVMGKHIVERLKHSSDMFINEYVTKCEKLTAVSGSAAETQRFMAARIGQAAFKARLKEAENAARYWQRQDLEDIPIGYQLVADERTNNKSGSDSSAQELSQPHGLPEKENMSRKAGSDPSEDWYRMGHKTLEMGLITTAVGLLLIGVAVKAGSDNDGLLMLGVIGIVPGVTVGPAAILAGLITIAIGNSQ
jgi:hypothetical protein